MEPPNFTRSRALNNIPSRKLQDALDAIKDSSDDLPTQNVKLIAANRYAESNIPLEYWTLKMDRDFKGDPRLLDKYNEYVSDIKASYINGKSICFAGNHGLGKTFAITNILKKSANKGYSCLYATLSDIVAVLTQASNEDKFLARRELSLVDFLAIDEVDSRFMSSENATDLYARNLESVFRARRQNKLPILMATNSPNIKEIFSGALKASVASLMSDYLTIFPVMGSDFRNKKETK